MEPAIIVQNITKTFKLPHERVNSLKSVIVNFYRRKKTYETQVAVQDVSFEVEKGEFFAIVGRNGSGKSTLLKMLAGIYTPTKGHIAVNGKLTPFIELGVGFNPDLTGRENVFLNGALLGFTRKEMLAKYDDIVEFAELERFMDQKLKNYSSGMQVRLAFSIAIRAKGDILLLDEVLAVGDSAFQQKCYNYFEELKEQRKTVVFVSHDMSAVRRFCTKAIYIKDGDLILDGNPFEVAERYEMDNLESTQKSHEKEDKPAGKSTVTAKIVKQTDTSLEFTITYKMEDDEEKYVGFSILRDGVSVAEATTSADLKLTANGKLSYTIDTTKFNAGTYQITAILCKHRNREMVAATNNKLYFGIKGNDITRGGAMKLEDTWKQL